MFSTAAWAAPILAAQEVILGICILILLFTRDSNTHVAQYADPQLEEGNQVRNPLG